jgi:hypothetical protein
MFDELKIYKENGHFFFNPGDKLADVCNAPDKPGVYYFVRLAKGKVDLVYIGASDTIDRKGTFRDQLLYGRLNNKQDGVKRQKFFEDIMKREQIDALDIYWFVTYDDDNHHLPSYVEAVLMQKYFDLHGCLPDWNKAF